jgi:hypothetical protein
MSDITTQLTNFRSIFNKLMKMWRNYPELFDLVKKHYTEHFKVTLTLENEGNENDGLVKYIVKYIRNVKPHLKHIKQHDDGIFTDDYIKEPFEIFKFIDMKYVWYKLSKDDRKQTWSYIEKLYVIGMYVTTEKEDLEKQQKLMYELYYNIDKDRIVSDASKYLVDNKLSVTQDIDTSDLTDEDFLEENCVSFEDKVEEAIDKLNDILSSMENGELLGKLIVKIVKKIKFPKKLMEKLEHITENPMAILKLVTDKRIVSHITGYMEKIKNSLTPEDLDVMKSIQNDGNMFEMFQQNLGKLFDGVFTSDEIETIFGKKDTDEQSGGELTVEQMELLKSKMSDGKIREVFEKTYKNFERVKHEKERSQKDEDKTSKRPSGTVPPIKDAEKTHKTQPSTKKRDSGDRREEMNISSLIEKIKEIDGGNTK